jgi:hypothetical protein
MARQIATIDCETDPFAKNRIPKPFVWGCYDGENFHYFLTADELIEFLSDKNWIVYAHNGGKFDFHYLIKYLEPFADVMIINGRLAKFKIGDCEFRDSYNILPVPLREMKKDDIEYWKLEEEFRQQYWDEIVDYLRSDCVYLYDYIARFNEQYGLNLTLASAAMKQWRKIANDGCPPTNMSFYQKFAPYYYGGRTQCFQSGIIGQKFEYADIVSAYPHAMTLEHPWGDVQETVIYDGGEILDQRFYKVKCRSRGQFPFRIKTGLSFPADNEYRQFYITGWELRAAMRWEPEADYQIERVTYFYNKINFKSYVDYFFAMKQSYSKGTPDYLFSKLFLNSLYGKFGSNPDNYFSYKVLDQKFIAAAEIDNMEFAGELGEWALMREKLAEEKMRFYNVATAASITGCVRAMLYSKIMELGRENIIYCDTDSIVYFGDPMPEKAGLGEFEAVDTCFYGGFAGKKLYAIQGTKTDPKTKMPHQHIATKGCRLEFNQILEIAKGGFVEYESEAPSFSVLSTPKFLKRKIQKTA